MTHGQCVSLQNPVSQRTLAVNSAQVCSGIRMTRVDRNTFNCSPTLLTQWAQPSPIQPTVTTVACGVRIVWFLMDCKECFPPHGHICCYLALVHIMLLIVEPSLFSLLRTLVSIILSLWFMDFCHWQHKSTLEKIQQPKGCLLTLIRIGFGRTNCMLPFLLVLTWPCQELTFSLRKVELLLARWAEPRGLQQGPETCL